MPRILSLLNFSAGLLFGIAAVALVFAAMEQDDILWSKRLLLTAAAAVIAGIVAKLVARPGRDRTRGATARRDGATTPDPARAATAPVDAASSRRAATADGRRASIVPPDLPAARTDSRGPATADGDARRL